MYMLYYLFIMLRVFDIKTTSYILFYLVHR